MAVDRRRFLKTSLAVGGATLVMGSRAYAAPNEQLNIGLIGAGNRGGQLAALFGKLPGVRLAAMCDVDRERAAACAAKHKCENVYTDYRDLLATASLDAVIVATCNHWHCLAAIHACEAGKHVYVEKPLGHDLWQQRQLVGAARRYNRIVQVGTQQRSDPMQDQIREFLHKEKGIGELTGVVATRIGARASIGKRSQPLTVPSSVDFDLWTGPAAKQPIYRDQLHYDWHWDWNTGDGEMGNWGVHILDDVRNVAFNDKVTLPTRATALGARVLWDDAGETPNIHISLLETGSIPVVCVVNNLKNPKDAKPLRVEKTETGYVVFADGGRYEGRRGGGTAFDSDGKVIRKFKGNSGELSHYQNFTDAVRAGDRKLLNADVEVGHYSSSWCHFGNGAYLAATQVATPEKIDALSDNPAWQVPLQAFRQSLEQQSIKLSAAPFVMSESLAVDVAGEKFARPVSDAANGPIRREYRQGFEIPEVNLAVR